jgi:gliding motility-associated-like protein
MKVAIKDLGCPDNKEDSATIKILVTPPPVIPPPNVLCVVPTTTTSLTLRWDNVDTSSKYFSHFMIKKIDPQGNEFEYGPFTKADKFEYTDFAVFDYRNRNYCYYIYAVNKCGEKGANSYTVCTIDQFNAPINTTSIVTATVEDNKNVKLVWFDSKEDDFDSYLIYRSLRTTTGHQGYSFYGSTNKTDDTTFIDKAVDVSKQSFCYRVQVTDQCGHISKFSNIGCNIVLQGISEPYLHKLNWDDYENWGNGVDNYKLIRWDDRKNPTQVYQGAPAVLNYNDEALDYDWGAYWYKVVATESGGNLAVSQSNEVRLIQKPLLHVPTAFTPTGDNLNDVWGLVDVFVKDYHMQVFNRWGEKVFESFDKNEQWNGSFARKGPADDVFIWLVRYTGWDNSIKIKKGTVTILN